MEFIDFFCIFLYMIASVLFIMGIKKLGKADTARKGNLVMRNMKPNVKEVFDITGFSNIIKIV